MDTWFRIQILRINIALHEHEVLFELNEYSSRAIYGKLVDGVDHHFFDYLNEFCSETLEKLKINFWDTRYNLDMFKKPSKRVEQLCIYGEGRRLRQSNSLHYVASAVTKDCLIRLFPQMRSLSLSVECSPFLHCECIANHFPNLEFLRICVPSKSNANCDTCKEAYRAIFRMNPQVKKLEFLGLKAINMMISFAEYLPDLEHLQFNGQNEFYGTVAPNDRNIHFKNVKQFAARCSVNNFDYDRQILPFLDKISFDRLDSFTFQFISLRDTRLLKQ